MNDNKHHPSFYNQVPELTLYYCMMGMGAIYVSKGEIIMFASSNNKKLPCGCAGTDVYRVVNKMGDKVLEKLSHSEQKYYEGGITEVIRLQGDDCNVYWENFYQKYPWLKPILISNLLGMNKIIKQ